MCVCVCVCARVCSSLVKDSCLSNLQWTTAPGRDYYYYYYYYYYYFFFTTIIIIIIMSSEGLAALVPVP